MKMDSDLFLFLRIIFTGLETIKQIQFNLLLNSLFFVEISETKLA